MKPWKVTLLAVLLVLAAGLAVAGSVRRRGLAPPPFPCLATAKTGWLTAVTSQALLRLEWGEGEGRVGVSALGDKPTWEPRDEASVRALALKVLEPISAPIRSRRSDQVSLFAGCDGVGAPWRGQTREVPTYQECLRPHAEGRVDCVQRVYRERDAPEEAAGAVAERIRAVVLERGVSLVETSVAPAPYRPSLSLRSPSKPGLLDEVIDRVLPAAPGPTDEY